ncbi:MAG: pyridoxamine 5'-phosphate oxidase [Acidimicrobiales bacterium]
MLHLDEAGGHRGFFATIVVVSGASSATAFSIEQVYPSALRWSIAGVLDHPLTGGPVVGLVAAGGSRKLHNLRTDPRATIVVRAGWQWATVEGTAEVFGPDDPHPELDGEALRVWLQDVFRAAGGTHDDWGTYDRTVAEERRAVALLTPVRTYTNPKS